MRDGQETLGEQSQRFFFAHVFDAGDDQPLNFAG